MNYMIKYVSGEPCFDALGVIKLSCAQSVPINDRIYAQAQLGRNDESLFVRIISFETKPAANARLTAVFCLGERELRMTVTAGGQAEAYCGDSDLTAQMTAYIKQGEDLQGEYWAGVLLFPLESLFAALDTDKTALPMTLSGNILRENPALSCAVPTNEVVAFTLK
ncbi:hypothetical protein ACS3UN_00880 [Oscillospiraceae bacterium LTW-04]|nr:hypothetical protein RBH76_09565 [Oscillospiraceae bacterium MB24-C1]